MWVRAVGARGVLRAGWRKTCAARALATLRQCSTAIALTYNNRPSHTRPPSATSLSYECNPQTLRPNIFAGAAADAAGGGAEPGRARAAARRLLPPAHRQPAGGAARGGGAGGAAAV